MDYTTLCSESQETAAPAAPSASKMQSLFEICQRVSDGRRARGKRYEVAGVLAVLAVAKLAGMTSMLGPANGLRIRPRRCARGCICRGNACRVPIRIAMCWRVWTVRR
jgi:hypothetical protein